MTLLLKDPDAVLDYTVDWGAEYLNEDQLASSDWSVAPIEPGGVSVVATDHSMTLSTVKVEGGLPGRLYRVINHVVLGSGREDSRSIVLRVEQR